MIGPLLKYESSLNYYNVVAALPVARLNEIAAQPDVVSIQPRPQPHKMDEQQDMIVSGNLTAGGQPTGPGYLTWLANRGFTQAQFTASGFAVDVSDSPVDNGTTSPNHFGLYLGGTRPGTSRVIYNRLEGTANSGSKLTAVDGHGNINTHIIGGYDDFSTVNVFEDSNGYHYGLGIAPYVKVGSSVIFDPSSFTNPSYPNLQSQAYNSGARVSSNSWGSDTAGAYDADCQAYDALVRDAQPTGSTNATAGNQEMVIVFAAGNAGSAASTVGSPGGAKNVLCVGASENVHAFGGADGCGETDAQADNANDIADFSSRGPCADGRIKPDIVAPGTHITGGVWQTASPAATGTADPGFNGSGVCGGVGSTFFPAGQQFYTASTGTSHSTPALAGACALVRQYFINQSLTPPSPAMTKAFLMNHARYLQGLSSGDTLPSNSQGMGLLDLGAAFNGGPSLLRDELATDKFTATGQTRTFTYSVSNPAKSVRVTLAWTDAAGATSGAAYDNNLDLSVTTNGQTYLGNVFSGRVSATGGKADAKNNVESVFLPGGGTNGTVTITITAANIVANGVPNDADALDQDFALVVSEADAAPAFAAGTATLVAESVSPANNAPDPGEIVTMSLVVKNTGSASTSNLIGTLAVNTGGVVSPGAAQSFGVIPAGGSLAQSFSFTVSSAVACGGTFTPTLSLQDGTTSYGTVSYAVRAGALASSSTVTGSSATTITIPTSGNAAPYPSTIAVNSASSNAQVSKVTATLTGFTHTYPSDVGVLLVAPNGTQFVPLMYAVGGSKAASNLTFTFDDAATASLPVSSALASGTFKPTVNGTPAFDAPAPTSGYGATMAALNAAPANGTWSLYVLDNATPDSGKFTGWSLNIATNAPVCTDTSTDVSISSVVVPGSPVAGQNVQFRYTVINNSAWPASGVVAGLPLPGGFTLVSTSQSQGTFAPSGSTLNFLLGQINAQSMATFTVTMRSPSSNQNAIYSIVASVSEDQTDNNTGNNSVGGGIVFSADSDGDGIPDQTEAFYGLNPGDPSDAARDLDGDGVSNLVEYLEGTALNDPNSRLSITSTTRDATTGAVNITFPSVSGHYYIVEYKNLLDDAGWTLLSDNIAGTGNAMTITDSSASGRSTRFYRVRLFVP